MSHNYQTLGNEDNLNARKLRENGTYINTADILERGTNAFGEQRVAMRYPQLTLNAGINLSERRDYFVTENGGTVTDGVGTIDVSVTSDAGSVAQAITASATVTTTFKINEHW